MNYGWMQVLLDLHLVKLLLISIIQCLILWLMQLMELFQELFILSNLKQRTLKITLNSVMKSDLLQLLLQLNLPFQLRILNYQLRHLLWLNGVKALQLKLQYLVIGYTWVKAQEYMILFIKETWILLRNHSL